MGSRNKVKVIVKDEVTGEETVNFLFTANARKARVIFNSIEMSKDVFEEVDGKTVKKTVYDEHDIEHSQGFAWAQSMIEPMHNFFTENRCFVSGNTSSEEDIMNAIFVDDASGIEFFLGNKETGWLGYFQACRNAKVSFSQ